MKRKIFQTVLAGSAIMILVSSCGMAYSPDPVPTESIVVSYPMDTARPVYMTFTPAFEPESEFVFPDYMATETLIPDSWKTFSFPDLDIKFQYPESWVMETLDRYSGKDGFFEIKIQEYSSTIFENLRTICILEANLHKTDLYGENPMIYDWQGWSKDGQNWFGNGCYVFPSSDMGNLGQATLFVRFMTEAGSNKIMILKADFTHFSAILSTLQMNSSTPSTPVSLTYTSPLCILSKAASDPQITKIDGLTITEYPIFDEGCHPYYHIDSFQTRLISVHANKMDHDIGSSLIGDDYVIGESMPVQVGSDSILWKYDREFVFPVGAPARLSVFRNDKTIFSMSIPHMSPGGGPVRALWSWNGHWFIEVENVLIMDGEIQNKQMGYEELFERHLVGGLPFYFYRKADKFGINYDGTVLSKNYDDLIHGFLCCDPGRYSLVSGDNGSAFYARRNGVWWYVVVEATRAEGN